jgi:hypothetical protein
MTTSYSNKWGFSNIGTQLFTQMIGAFKNLVKSIFRSDHIGFQLICFWKIKINTHIYIYDSHLLRRLWRRQTHAC